MSEQLANTVLEHHGVKGMKWGQHKTGRTKTKAANSSDDVKAVNEAKSKIKEHRGTHVLSNKDLQSVVTRMNLEQQYTNLNSKKKKTLDKGNDQAKRMLGVTGTAVAAYNVGKSPFGKAVGNILVNQIHSTWK